ncbi:MAG TPA: multicopper oxidase family protein [Solirubrobacteraceae bacterium]|nr:multicopper oxidase family protein [Solirubrobacteraceae bacterium]
MHLSRRDLLKVGLFSSAALMLPAERVARTQLAIANRMPQSGLPEFFSLPFAKPPVLQTFAQSADTDYYLIRQQQTHVPILGPGRPATTIWGYNGITPGPTIVAHRNRKTVVRQINELPGRHEAWGYQVWTSTHLHGSASLPEYDGYASDITPPGFAKDYRYPQIQDARTLWYHDHGVHITAENAYMGLAAMYVMHDDHELSLPIPHGNYDVPLVIKDAMFDKDGELVADDNSESGIFGDVILVNGVPWPNMRVEPRKYRFRVLNASVSRSYDLSLDTGEPLVVIGTDGGLMPHPQACERVKVGMAERYEIVIDFSKYKPGQRVVLQNTSPKNNIDYDTTHVVMAFMVGDHVSTLAGNQIPQDLNPHSAVMALSESDVSKDERGRPIVRNMRFERSGSNWTVNGQTWEDVVNSDYNLVCATVKPNDVEIWELDNPSGGWFHPVHIHLVDFKILDRNGRRPEPYELGPKDTAYVGENEKVRVLMRFAHHQGKYMMHCHNLVHEDHDMMTQFQVGDASRDTDPHDPIEADKCKALKDLDELYKEPRKPDNSGTGSGGGILVPAAIPAAPAPAQVKVLGSVKTSKPKRKAKKVKLKAKPKRKLTAKKSVKARAKAKPKAGARKSRSARNLRSKRLSGGGRS